MITAGRLTSGKRMRRLLFAFALAFAALISSWPATGRAQEPIHIAYPEYRPFFYADANGIMHGFFYEIIEEAVSRRMGIATSWRCYPWSRCQMLVKNARADAMITVPTEERAAYTVTHKHPFYAKPLVLFTYKHHPRMPEIEALRTIQDIKKAGFSVVTYSGNGWNKQLVESVGIPVVETPWLPSVWQMLAGRRADLAIEWPTSAWPDIHAVDVQDKIVQTGVSISAMPFHLLISKHSPYADVLPLFDEVIRSMREDGTIDRILIRYNIHD